ncbi:MAG: ATP-binding protein [Paracoccus sp. (in: a-proteobacteria)]|uniref:ATP-binding protein n=2 Tax=Paracoccus sp. TaxID=267 RepID=UPI0040594FDA
MSRIVTRPEGERKQVTAVFLDLVGFSEVASTSDAEDLQDWLEEYYRRCGEIVEINGGEVTEYLGDGIVAVFGLSRADELAASKAVDAALRAVTELAQDKAGQGGFTLRAGVATGEVAVRPDMTREAWPRITGTVTTLAQRVQELAAPGGVMIAEGTRMMLRGQFTLTPVPNQILKGFAQPQMLFVPQIAPHRDVAPGTADLVGRAKECAAIEAARMPVLIVGQAGIGKTAVAQHMAQRAGIATTIQAEGIKSGSSYQPFKDWISWRLKSLTPDFAEITQGFPDLSKADRMSLALIMGLPEGAALLTELSNLALKARIEAGLWRALQSVQRDGMVIFEDLHWFDIASFGVLQHILRSPERSRFRLILTSREDSKLGKHLSGLVFETLSLHPLSQGDAHRMLASLGAQDGVNAASLVEQAGGIPLYLDQLAKRALKIGRVEETVPDTLMDLLAARIDDTGPAKPILQRASAIGRIFAVDLLRALDPTSADPVFALEHARAAGVVMQRSAAEWEFAHALLAQAAYHSVLRSNREALHRRIAEILQSSHVDRISRDPALLARHQRKARQIGPAIRSYLAASRIGLLQGAFADAEGHAGTALALCDDLDDASARAEMAIACQTARGSVLMQAQGFTAEPVRDAFGAVHRIALSSGSLGPNSAAALFGSFSHAIIAGDKSRADAFDALLADLAQSMPAGAGGDEVRLAALATRNCGCFYQGDFRTQFRQIERIRDLYRIADHAGMIARYGMDIFAAAQMFEAPARAISGQIDAVERLVAETDAHQAELSIPAMLPYALIWGAVPLFYGGRQPEALARLRRGMALADEQGAVFWQVTGATWSFIMDPSQSLDEPGLAAFKANIELQRAIGARVGLPYFSACYAERLAAAGRVTEAYHVSSAAVVEARESGLHCWYPEILRIHSGICRSDNHPGEAEAAMKLALDTATRQGAALWSLRATLDLSCHDVPDDQGLAAALNAFPRDAVLPELGRAKVLLSQ